jgi:hypothetical protein
MRHMTLAIVIAAWLAPGLAFAQAAPVEPPAASAPERAVFSLGVVYGHDDYHYHFDNPSRFNTADTVPHYFEQDHEFDGPWVTGSARYRFAGRSWETRGRVSWPVSGAGKDYDTFFNPDGNVIVYGTTADTSAWSFEVGQTVEIGAARGFVGRIGYSYRRDRAEYHDSWSTTSTTKPPSQSQFWNTGRESTISQVHQVRAGVSRDVQASNRLRLHVVADCAPATLAHLTTLLPDKYPDQPIVFVAKAVSLEALADLAYAGGRTSWHIVLAYSGAWDYSSSSAFTRGGYQAGVLLSF